MVSINDVRETVLAICNKNNYGYISPDDFNLYAKQAQLEVFDEYMSKYNYYTNLENSHTAGSDLADLAEAARESIEMFVNGTTLAFSAPSGAYSVFTAPSDWYHINTITYEIQPNVFVEVAKESRLNITRLLNSNLTAPTPTYPMYAMGQNNSIAIVPNSIDNTATVECIYVRYPVDPYWGYQNLVNGEPVFDPTNPLTQDFELAEEDEPVLINKILEKAGLSIREIEVYKVAQMNDNQQQ
jgi:hypothetical protein